MALLECDRSRPIFFLRKTSSAPYPFHTELKYYDQTQSASTSPNNKRKVRLNHDFPIDDMIIDAKSAVQMPSRSSSNVIEKQLFSHTTGLSPGTRRLKISSASVSPLKPAVIPKRLATSELSSPCPLKKKVGTLAISLPTSKQPNHESQSQTHSESISSSQGEHDNASLSPGLSSPSMFPGLSEFSFCDQCAKLCSRSLDFWMDHLGECHPVPVSWPSIRADHLDERGKMNPYTAVVGSNKKRKGSGIPRPLNSFMIFAQYLRRVVLHWFPDAPNVHISQRVGQLWRKLDSNMREQYALEAFRLQKLHSIEFPNYKYQPRKRPHNTHSNVSTEPKTNDTPRAATTIRERDTVTTPIQSTFSAPCSGTNKNLPRSNNLLNNHHSIIYLNNLLQDYDASRIPALVIAHHGNQSGEIIVQESSKDTLKQFISSQHFTELKPFQICTTLNDTQKSLSKYCLDKLLLSEGSQADETLTSLVSGQNTEEQSPTISSTSNSTEIDGTSLRSKSLDVNCCSDEPLDYRFHNGRTHMIEDLLTTTATPAAFCPNQIYNRQLNSKTPTNNVTLLGHSNVLGSSTEFIKLEDLGNSEQLLDSESYNIRLATVPLQITVPSSCCTIDSNLILRSSIKQEMDNAETDNSQKSENLGIRCKISRLENVMNSSNLTHKLNGQTNLVAMDIVDGRPNTKLLSCPKSGLDTVSTTATNTITTTSSSTAIATPTAANVLLDSNKLDVYVNFDDLDTGFGFDDIDTCKSGTSLDDLDQIVLFNTNLSSDKSIHDHSNSLADYQLLTTTTASGSSSSSIGSNGSKAYDSETLLTTTVDEVLGTITDSNGLSIVGNTPYHCVGARQQSADFTLLPSIESWTFGALNSGN